MKPGKLAETIGGAADSSGDPESTTAGVRGQRVTAPVGRGRGGGATICQTFSAQHPTIAPQTLLRFPLHLSFVLR